MDRLHPAPADEVDPASLFLGRLAWHAQAACRGMDPNLFFPHALQSNKSAKSVCSECPVTEECAEAGLNEGFGVRGGMSVRQRQRLRRARRQAA